MAGYLMVTNGRAGGWAEERVDAAREVLAGYGPVETVACESADDLDRAIANLDERTLVVAGGDGSVHLCAARLRAAGRLGRATVGLVPLGTGNDLARGLGVPLDPADAARVVAAGQGRRLDVLVDDVGGIVLNAVHAGVGAEAALQADRVKPGLGPIAYPVGALLAGVLEPGWELRVTVDGQSLSLDQPVLMVAVANGPTIGGGTPLCPRAVPDDGVVDVVAVTATGPAARAAFGAALRSGQHLDRDDVTYRRGREVTISGEGVRFNADGEVSEACTRRSFRVERLAWTVLAPPP